MILKTKIKTKNNHIKPGGHSTPDTCSVGLVWWKLPATGANKAWGKEPPHCREVTVTVLGIWSARRVRYTVHAILPQEPLPEMNSGSKALFVKAAKSALAENLGVIIEGVRTDIVDWEGSDEHSE